MVNELYKKEKKQGREITRRERRDCEDRQKGEAIREGMTGGRRTVGKGKEEEVEEED